MDCSTSEMLARRSPFPVLIEELDESVQDCLGICCKVDMNSPFQPQDKEVLSSFTKGGRNFMCKWYKIHPWLTVKKEKKPSACIVGMLQIMDY